MDSPLQAVETCEICRKILEVATFALQVDTLPNPKEAKIERTWVHGETGSTSASSECKAHIEFLEGLRFPFQSSVPVGVTITLSYSCIGMFISTDNDFTKLQVISPITSHRPSLIRHVLTGRPIDSGYIDFDLVHKWQSYCEGNHGIKCSRTYVQTPSTFPAWLIDTTQSCLVQGSFETPFVALSYVWGKIEMLKTQKDNLFLHQEPGAFEWTTGYIPRTIRDAMRLVPLIGKRYLWVDSLCVVQDDEQSLQSDLRQMAMIFESAALTIVANDGDDADYGLRGIPGVPTPRARQPVLKLTNTISITGNQSKPCYESTWASRGWTMQEALFSRRKLHFVDNSIRWVCRSNEYYEDVDAPLDWQYEYGCEDIYQLIVRRPVYENRLSLGAGLALDYPDMNHFETLVYHYNHRLFSFEEDVLLAIASTLVCFEQQAFPRGFLQGIPISFFDLGLLWSYNFAEIESRQASNLSRLCAPSWTWASRRGLVHIPNLKLNNYLKSDYQTYLDPEDGQVIPYLNWYTCTQPNVDPEPILHQNEWYHFKDRYMGKKQHLPEGWKFVYDTYDDCEKYKITLKNYLELKTEHGRLFPDNLFTNYHYTHVSVPHIKFVHPVPLGRSLEASEGANTGRYLWTRTQQANLLAAKPPHFDHESLKCRTISRYAHSPQSLVLLAENASQFVGDISMDSQDYDIPKIQLLGNSLEAGNAPPGKPLSIVAVSRGSHWPEPMEPSQETYSFYNVMAVRWEDGIAYRQGIGRVEREAWESLQKEDIELILG